MTIYQIISLFLALSYGGWFLVGSAATIFLKKGSIGIVEHLVTCLLVVNCLISFLGVK